MPQAVLWLDSAKDFNSMSRPQAGPEPPAPEVLYLIARALEDGPLAHLGAALAREASEQGLLPCRMDVLGAPAVGGLGSRAPTQARCSSR